MNVPRHAQLGILGAVLKKMRLEARVGIAAVLFLVSFFLPAYKIDGCNLKGYDCLGICIRIMGDRSFESLYYVGFVFVNFAFCAIVTHVLLSHRHRMVTSIIGIASTLYVASWAAVNLFQDAGMGTNMLGIGYYIWLASFGILAVSLIRFQTT